jgi:thiamine-phosphate pyrophosphorylase
MMRPVCPPPPRFVLPRLYPILDTGLLARREMDPVIAAGAMLEGGARILQWRHKGHWNREDFKRAAYVAALCADAGAFFIVNDRADMALLLDAGLHLGQDDLPPRDARRIVGEKAVVGFSTHNSEQLAAAALEPLQYVAVGPVFGTASKQNPDPVVGVDWLRTVEKRLPLVAIGGITRATVPLVLAAGADSVAVISDLVPEECTRAGLRARMEEWLRVVGTR